MNYLVRNIIISKLADLGFILHWEHEEPETESWLQLSWGLGRLKLENVVDGLAKLKQFHTLINSLLKSKKVSLEWNYLGLAADRENYLKLLEDFFWQNQNEQEIIAHEEYLSWLENPWKLLNQTTNLGLDIPLASDFFTDSSLNFFENLEQTLASATNTTNFQPYLIVSDQASFQWSINLESEKIISGVVISSGKTSYLEVYLN